MFEPDIVSCIPQNFLLLNPLKAHTLEHPASNKAKKKRRPIAAPGVILLPGVNIYLASPKR